MTEIQCSPHPQGQQIASTIRRQIGTDVWLAVSARNPRWWTSPTGDVVFAFRFGSRYGLAKWCEITYQSSSDDYDLIAYKVHRNGVKSTLSLPSEYEADGVERAEYEGLYADTLPTFVRSVNLMGEFA